MKLKLRKLIILLSLSTSVLFAQNQSAEISKQEAQKLQQELKREIQEINDQIAQGLDPKVGDSLKLAKTKARLRAFESRIREEQKQAEGTQEILDTDKVLAVELLNDDVEYTFLSDGLVLAFGFNNAIIEGERLQDSPYKYFGSRFFEIGWSWKRPLSLKDPRWQIKYGTSFMINGFKITDNRILVKENNQVFFEPFQYPLTKSKLTITQLVFPLHLHFGPTQKVLNKADLGPVTLKHYGMKNNSALRFGIGGYVGFNIRNVHKLKYRIDGKRKKDKYKDHLNVNDLVVGLSGYISLGNDAMLYAKYELTPLFEADKRAQHPIGIGWRLNLD